jgi:hypothetical protein
MRLRFPSPALVIAVLALFVALSGTAVAAGVVPLAKRALTADNAKKVGGQTAGQISAAAAAQPGPASSAAGLTSIRSAPVSIGAQAVSPATVACAAGEKASGGGFALASGAPVLISSAPTSDGSGWTVLVLNVGNGGATGNAYAVCVK